MFDDPGIVNKVLKGDLRAFELIVKQYENLVFYVTHRLVSNQLDVEDICQEVFIKVHKNLSYFKFESKLSTWIAQIAYRTAINHLKKYKSKFEILDPKQVDQHYITADDPGEILAKNNISDYINLVMGQMPKHYKIVLTLYHLNEFSYYEIETITGMPEGTVKSNLFRARKLLKEKLEEYLKNEIV